MGIMKLLTVIFMEDNIMETTGLNTDLYSAKEAAEKLGRNYKTFVGQIRRGEVEAVNLSKGEGKARYFISEEELFRLKRGLPKLEKKTEEKSETPEEVKPFITREQFMHPPVRALAEPESEPEKQVEPKPFGTARKERKVETLRESAEILKLKSRVKVLTSELMDILVELDELTK
jgi:hypothetical protein